MQSYLTHTIALERNQDLRQAADRHRLAASAVNEKPVQEPGRMARLRTLLARLTSEFAETAP